ncbi:tetratricopeptide repeat protein [Nonomuraea sp. B12E4]|uniref:tetratricopeptide repeat protein n=1 Tax=Nonomuraea sp. B12E4 TaxID=3153564 RepID=UPI00325E5E24
MTRNGPDDAIGGISEARAIEGLLAFAQRGPRWGGRALKTVNMAIERSRALSEEFPGAHTELLTRSLLAAARLHLKRGRATEALPLAEEAVEISRAAGGGPLVVSLNWLATILEALHRYSEAAATIAEADEIKPPD